MYVKSKFPKCPPAFQLRTITKPNADKLIELLRQTTAPPQSELHAQKDDGFHYCTFKDFPEKCTNINSTVRHSRAIHYKGDGTTTNVYRIAIWHLYVCLNPCFWNQLPESIDVIKSATKSMVKN